MLPPTPTNSAQNRGAPFFWGKKKMKLPTTMSEQINLLKSRGLVFNDEVKAINTLLHNNYYRLTGYWRKYQINPDAKDDRFVNNTKFEDIIEIYTIDAKLRNLLLEGLGIFEVYI